jgi:NhaP-type Na+/H+ or K+/H+ antiporter
MMSSDLAELLFVGAFACGVFFGYVLRYFQSRVLRRRLEVATMLLHAHGVFPD